MTPAKRQPPPSRAARTGSSPKTSILESTPAPLATLHALLPSPILLLPLPLLFLFLLLLLLLLSLLGAEAAVGKTVVGGAVLVVDAAVETTADRSGGTGGTGGDVTVGSGLVAVRAPVEVGVIVGHAKLAVEQSAGHVVQLSRGG